MLPIMAGVNSEKGTPKTLKDALAMVCLDVSIYSTISPVGMHAQT